MSGFNMKINIEPTVQNISEVGSSKQLLEKQEASDPSTNFSIDYPFLYH